MIMVQLFCSDYGMEGFFSSKPVANSTQLVEKVKTSEGTGVIVKPQVKRLKLGACRLIGYIFNFNYLQFVFILEFLYNAQVIIIVS